MMAQRNITDRAKRYRAQNVLTGPKKCIICGSTKNIDVMHLDGNESHGQPDNLAYGCRSCNGLLAAAFKRAGKGVPTNQYNPAGAQSVGEWLSAVAAIDPHKGEGYAGRYYGLVPTMSPSDAVTLIRATPQSRREDFAAQLNKHKRSRSQANSGWFSTHKHYTRSGSGLWRDADRSKADAANQKFLERERAKETKAKKVAAKTAKPGTAGRYRGYTISRTSDGEYFSSLDRDSWFPTAAAAKRHVDYVKEYQNRNPASLERCVKAVKKRGGAVSPYAVCTAQQKRRKGNPASQYLWEVQYGGEVIGTIEAVSREWALKKAFSKWGGKKANYWVRKLSIINPAAAAAEGYEEFHGHPSKEVVTVKKKIHFHSHLSGAGELRKLQVRGIDRELHGISGFKGALLAFNEAKSQLFIEGGDQSLDLAEFGIRKPHELETLGKVTGIDYQTDKSHLGKEGGKAVYAHQFRTTNENGQHVVVKIARYPDLIYRVLDEQLEFSGGSYVIRAEGIDK